MNWFLHDRSLRHEIVKKETRNPSKILSLFGLWFSCRFSEIFEKNKWLIFLNWIILGSFELWWSAPVNDASVFRIFRVIIVKRLIFRGYKKNKNCTFPLNKFSSQVTIINLYIWANNSMNLQKQPSELFSKKKCSEIFRKIHRKTPVPEALFNKAASWGLLATGTGVFCEFCKISKNTFFTEHHRATASKTKTFASKETNTWDKRHHC